MTNNNYKSCSPILGTASGTNTCSRTRKRLFQEQASPEEQERSLTQATKRKRIQQENKEEPVPVKKQHLKEIEKEEEEDNLLRFSNIPNLHSCSQDSSPVHCEIFEFQWEDIVFEKTEEATLEQYNNERKDTDLKSVVIQRTLLSGPKDPTGGGNDFEFDNFFSSYVGL